MLKMAVKIAAATSDPLSVGTPPLAVPGDMTAFMIDSPPQRVNTTTGKSRATTHLIKSLRVSVAGSRILELLDRDTAASPHFRLSMFTTSKHARILYTFSGTC